ncbi:MAG: DPP IV N-terminal domain-containing protein, partial [Chloroflexi bacterium]|nr:DPP IV N-terminal domain-containing protein [Chloroflexota bacterium]
DLWLTGVNNGVSAKVGEHVGMWANPAWGEAGIAFGETVDPLQSANSRYFVQLIDRDGSNKRQLFPFREELGVQLPELVWSSQGEMLLFTYNGNLYIINSKGGLPKQLTSDGQAATSPAVGIGTITVTTPITNPVESTATLTQAQSMTTPATIPTDNTTIQATSTVTITPSLKAYEDKGNRTP